MAGPTAEHEPLAVLMLTENYLPLTGGTERQVEVLAGALAARGLRVEILTAQRRPEWPLHEMRGVVQVHRLPYPKVRRLATLVVLLRAATFLIVRGRRFAVFHVHTANVLAVVAVLIGTLTRRPVVIKTTGAWELAHGVLGPAVRRRLRDRVAIAVLRRADMWIAVSRELQQAIQQAGVPVARIRLVPNGVDTGYFEPHAGADARPRAVFVGRLVPEKALPTLLRAWTGVTRRVAGASLDIVGDGALLPELSALAASLGLAASVRFLGHQSDVRPFLHDALAFVLPSRVEGLSNALLEAMAVGLPVVATRVGGADEVVLDGDTGRLVPPDDPEALAEALIDLLGSPVRAREMGRRGREHVVERYDLGVVASAYLALYRELLGGRRRAAGARQS